MVNSGFDTKASQCHLLSIGGYGDITSTAPFRFGSNNTVSSGFFDGAMDDIRVYDRVLTQAEIAHLASSRGIEGPPPVGSW